MWESGFKEDLRYGSPAGGRALIMQNTRRVRLKVAFIVFGFVIATLIWKISLPGAEVSSWESVQIPPSLYGAESTQIFAWLEDQFNVRVIAPIPERVVVVEEKHPPPNIKAVLDSLARGLQGSWSQQGNTLIFSRSPRSTGEAMESRRASWNKLVLFLRSLSPELREHLERGKPVILHTLSPPSLQHLGEFLAPFLSQESWEKLIQMDSDKQRVTCVLTYDPVLRIDFQMERQPVELHFGTASTIPRLDTP
jgi:hypothetical protein